MNIFSLIGIFLSILCFGLTVFISFKASNKTQRIWAIFNIILCLWGLIIFLIGIERNYSVVSLYWKAFLIILAFIFIAFYHLVYVYCENQKRFFLIFTYFQGIIFSLLTIGTNLVSKSPYLFLNQFYYLKGTVTFSIFFIIWIAILIKALLGLWKYIQISTDTKRLQAKYLFYSALLGFFGGATTAPPAYGIEIYPIGHILVGVYAIICTYAILRFQLMDIRVAITRIGIFAVVYILVLGIPIWIGINMLGLGKWLIPVCIMGVFATAGPFIYLFFQKRSENRLLAEQKRAQTTLRLFSAGMMKIRDLEKLLGSIVNVLQQNLRPVHTAIYLKNNEQEYDVRANLNYTQEIVLSEESPLIQILRERKYPIIDEEERHNAGDLKDWNKKEIEIITEMQRLSASVSIPVLSGEDLLGFILLGRRESKNLFSNEMIETLYSFSVQFALALENIKSIAERERLLNENFEIRRLESLGLVVNSVSHQFNNRFHAQQALMFNPIEIYDEGKYKELKGEEQLKELITLVEDFADTCKKVNEMAEHGGEVTKSILNFSKGSTTFGDVKFDQAVDESVAFVKIKYPKFAYEVLKDYPKDLIIWGTTVGIKEIIQTAVDNSCYFMQKKLERGAEYKPTITIRAKLNGKVSCLDIEDNGIGIKKENLRKVMEPMYSTKGHADGTGMGTYTMRHIVMKHKGTIVFESEFDVWTKVKIALPLGIIPKSRFLELGTNGEVFLSELIKKEIIEDHSTSHFRLESNLEKEEEKVQKIIKEAGGNDSDTDKIWAILQSGLAI